MRFSECSSDGRVVPKSVQVSSITDRKGVESLLKNDVQKWKSGRVKSSKVTSNNVASNVAALKLAPVQTSAERLLIPDHL